MHEFTVIDYTVSPSTNNTHIIIIRSIKSYHTRYYTRICSSPEGFHDQNIYEQYKFIGMNE